MAILKANDARGLADEQLKEKLSACISELALERGQIKTGGRTSNPGKIGELRRTISRIRTILHERKLGIVRVPVEKKKGAKATDAKTAANPNEQKPQAAGVSSPSNAQIKTETGTKNIAASNVQNAAGAKAAVSAVPSPTDAKKVEAKPPEKR